MTLWCDEHPRPPVNLARLAAAVARVGVLWTLCAALSYLVVSAGMGI